MRRIRILLHLTALLAMMPIASAAQRQPAVVAGRVMLGDSAATGVLVRIASANVGTLTDSIGRYRLVIPPDRFSDGAHVTIQAVRAAVRADSQHIQLATGSTQEVNFWLKPAPRIADVGPIGVPPAPRTTASRPPAVVMGRALLPSGGAAANVLVRVESANAGTMTDSTGRYHLVIPSERFADGDSATLLAVRMALRRLTRIQLVAGRTQEIDVRMKTWAGMADAWCVTIVDPRGIARPRSDAETRKLCAMLPSFVRTRGRGASRSP